MMLREIWQRRSLIQQLILKDLRIRYSRPFLGFIWMFLSPLLMVVIFYLVFSVIFKIKTEEAPFFLYLMTAVFPWRFFQESLVSSTTSLVDSKNLIRESNFPHYLIPISIVLANIINFLPSLLVVVLVSLFMLNGLPSSIVFLPLVLILHLVITIGLSIILSLLYVKWRDLKYILEASLLLLFYLTPAVYSLNIVEASFSPLLFKIYIYNPMVGILILYRMTLLRGFSPGVHRDIDLFAIGVIPIVFAIVMLLLGFYFYKKNKHSINDYLSY